MVHSLLAAADKPKKTVSPRRRVSLVAYFRAEEKALDKHEYHNGIIKPMPGGSLNHARLSVQMCTILNVYVFDSNFNYIVAGSDIKIRIEAQNSVVYPDAVVICEDVQYFEGRTDTILNPLIVVEALSPSTEKYDRESKFELYRTIPSFREYVLIHQDKKQVTVYTRQADATWIVRDYHGDEAIAILYALHNCPLPLKRLYHGLIF